MCTAVLDKFNVSQYYFTSLLYRLNPLTKIICMLLFILMVLASNDFISLILLIVLVSLMMYISKVPFGMYYLVTKKFWYLLLAMFVLFLVFTFSLSTGILILVKTILVLIMLEIFMLTSLTEIIYGLNELLKPLEKHKVKTKKITFKIAVGLSKILDLLYNLNEIFKENLIYINIKAKTVSKYNKIKYEAIIKKMKTNGFDINHSRTYRHVNSLNKLDTYVMAFYSLVFIIILVEGALL